MAKLITRIANGKLWLKDQIIERDVIINDDKIRSIIRRTETANVDKVINAEGAIVLPGLIDSHVHLRDGELAYKEDFNTGTKAAVAGGFTLVIDMPNMIPPTSTIERLLERISIAKNKILCDVGFYAMPTKIDQLYSLAKAGCFGFKIYTHRIFEEADFSDPVLLGELIREVKKIGLPLVIHAENPAKFNSLGENFDAVDHAWSHPPEAESSMINTILNIARNLDLEIHFCHISTSEGIKTLTNAKSSNHNIKIEVTPHHLCLDSSILEQCRKKCVVEPPLRDSSHVFSLREALWNNNIDLISTDHAPHTLSEKNSDKPIGGFPGLETAIPVLLTYIKKGILPFSNTIRSLTEQPSKILPVTDHGTIEENKIANLTFVKFIPPYKIDPSKFYSKSKYSPFENFMAEAAVMRTIVRGETVFTREEGTLDLIKGKTVERTYEVYN